MQTDCENLGANPAHIKTASQTPQPVLSVVIPTHARPDSLVTCLKSLMDQDLAYDKFEVFVVSNHHDDRVSSLCELMNRNGFPLVYTWVGRAGVNRARNAGLKFCRGQLVYFLDDDCQLRSASHLSQVISLHEQFPQVGAIGGPYVTPGSANLLNHFYNQLINRWLFSQSVGDQGQVLLLGGNLSIKKSILGPQMRFDENISYGGSEISLQRELFALGHNSRTHRDLGVHHYFSGSCTLLMRKAWAQGWAKHQYSQHQHRTRLRVVFKKRIAFSYLAHGPKSRKSAQSIGFAAFTIIYLGLAQSAWFSALVTVKLKAIRMAHL